MTRPDVHCVCGNIHFSVSFSLLNLYFTSLDSNISNINNFQWTRTTKWRNRDDSRWTCKERRWQTMCFTTHLSLKAEKKTRETITNNTDRDGGGSNYPEAIVTERERFVVMTAAVWQMREEESRIRLLREDCSCSSHVTQISERQKKNNTSHYSERRAATLTAHIRQEVMSRFRPGWHVNIDQTPFLLFQTQHQSELCVPQHIGVHLNISLFILKQKMSEDVRITSGT